MILIAALWGWPQIFVASQVWPHIQEPFVLLCQVQRLDCLVTMWALLQRHTDQEPCDYYRVARWTLPRDYRVTGVQQPLPGLQARMCSDALCGLIVLGKENAICWGGLTGLPGALAASPAMVVPRRENVGRLWNRQEKAWLLVSDKSLWSLESECKAPWLCINQPKNCLEGKECVGNSTESKACGDLKLGKMDVSLM